MGRRAGEDGARREGQPHRPRRRPARHRWRSSPRAGRWSAGPTIPTGWRLSRRTACSGCIDSNINPTDSVAPPGIDRCGVGSFPGRPPPVRPVTGLTPVGPMGSDGPAAGTLTGRLRAGPNGRPFPEPVAEPVGPGRPRDYSLGLPQIRACTLNAPGSSRCGASLSLTRPGRFAVTRPQGTVSSAWFQLPVHNAAPPSLHGVRKGRSPASSLLWGAATS